MTYPAFRSNRSGAWPQRPFIDTDGAPRDETVGDEIVNFLLGWGACVKEVVDDTPPPSQQQPLDMVFSVGNSARIKALLDACPISQEITQLLCSRDSNGRLPLHWAMTRSPRGLSIHSSGFCLMARAGSSMPGITRGVTPLYDAIATHAGCSGSERGPTLISDGDGQNAVHILAYCLVGSEPVDIPTLELLVAHGVDVHHADKNGKTPLHIMARNLRQGLAVRSPLGQSTDVRAVNEKGSTALHEAARRIYAPQMVGDGVAHATIAGRVKVQDEVMGVLMEAAAGDDGIMDQADVVGKTPRRRRGAFSRRRGRR
ncbi:hypothetical protein BJX76DRAFT_359229 [Aspergillus varians]